MARTCLPISRTLATLPAQQQVVLLLRENMVIDQPSWQVHCSALASLHKSTLNDIFQIKMLTPPCPSKPWMIFSRSKCWPPVSLQTLNDIFQIEMLNPRVPPSKPWMISFRSKCWSPVSLQTLNDIFQINMLILRVPPNLEWYLLDQYVDPSCPSDDAIETNVCCGALFPRIHSAEVGSFLSTHNNK